MTVTNLQPDETTGIDTYINKYSPSVNYATSDAMYIGETNSSPSKVMRGLLKFDLSSIDSDAQVSAVTLSLWFKADDATLGATVKVFRCLVPWAEATATWNKYDSTNYWGTPGGLAGTDYESAEVGSTTITASETPDTELQITINAYSVQQMIYGGSPNYGYIIKTVSEADDNYSYHSSSAATAGYRPKLSVTWTSGANYENAAGNLPFSGTMDKQFNRLIAGGISPTGDLAEPGLYPYGIRITSSGNRRITSSSAEGWRITNNAQSSLYSLGGAISSIAGVLTSIRRFSMSLIRLPRK